MKPALSTNQNLLADGQRLAGQLPPLLVAAERVAATVWQGVHGRRRVGQGDAFWQFRSYQPGDAPLRIDWKQSAKSQQVYVRQSEWEAVQSVWLWRDASASMAYRSQRTLPEKRERADLLVMALAALLTRAGEHVALISQNEPPATGRSALLRMAMALSTTTAAAGSLPPAVPLPRYAHVILVGDWLASHAEVNAMVDRLTAAGLCGHLVQILDPAEETLPFAGRIRFEGSEGEDHILLSRVEAVRAEYCARLSAHRDQLRAITRTFGWTFHLHHTDQPPTPALLSLYTVLAKSRGN